MQKKHPLRNVLARRTAPWALALLSAAAWGAPSAAPEDPVSRFLAEKGLIEAATSQPGPAATAAEPQGERRLMDQVRDKASDMVVTAMNFLGVRYRRGGNSAEEGFDCSGFTRHIFESSLGLVLPRRVDEQASAPGLEKVSRNELKPGDLVFFNTLRRTFSHVGIYVGEGKFIHSPRTGAAVRIEDMRGSYWNKRFTGARRPHAAEARAEARAGEARPQPSASSEGQRQGRQAPAASTALYPSFDHDRP